MTFHQLIAEHEAIEQLARALIRLSGGEPRPAAASHMLEDLSQQVRDHLSHEDPIVYATAAAVAGGRHNDAAVTSVATYESLKEDWGGYLYRWDRDTVVRDWTRFGSETATMLERLSERVAAETAVLYSLAVHHDLLEPGEGRPEPR